MHTAVLSVHTAVLSIHTAVLSVHTAVLSMHNAVLSVHTAVLSKHTAVLSMHTAVLSVHTAVLSMHFLKSAQPNPFCSISSPPLDTQSCWPIIYEEEMCPSIWPTYRRSFRRGWWLVTHCIILSALGHDNEPGACVWSVSATVVESSEQWTQLHNWETDGLQVLRNFK